MTKLKETIIDWKDFILLCVTIVLIAGCFFISKAFEVFFIRQRKRSETPKHSFTKIDFFYHQNPIEA